MIVCKDLRKSYSHGGRRKHVLKGVDLVINPGDRIGLLGRNGAGKSTLIKLIGGVEMPTSGTITRHMSVSWPLGFAGGFQGSLTGYDNARFIAPHLWSKLSGNQTVRGGFHRTGSAAPNARQDLLFRHAGKACIRFVSGDRI